VLINQVWLYFAFELTVLNILLMAVLKKQRSIASVLWRNLELDRKDLFK
jgi:hypothetical protein